MASFIFEEVDELKSFVNEKIKKTVCAAKQLLASAVSVIAAHAQAKRLK